MKYKIGFHLEQSDWLEDEYVTIEADDDDKAIDKAIAFAEKKYGETSRIDICEIEEIICDGCDLYPEFHEAEVR